MSEPRPASITAPLSRLLAVADLPRSLAFYRDCLGFAVQPDSSPAGAVVVRGPARVELAVGDTALDSRLEPRPRGAAVLFFQTDDVAALQAELDRRGARPSRPEAVNWIKLRMFQVRDPDGHTLWFGQSFAEPAAPRPEPWLEQIMPEIPLDDVAAGVAYYRDRLGFSVNYVQDDLAVLDRDRARVLLIGRGPDHRGIGSCYVYVRDADALWRELVENGARVLAEPVSRPWGLREFEVRDPEGNRLTFGQPFE